MPEQVKENTSQEEIIEDLKSIIAETFRINTDQVDPETKLFDGGLSLNSIQMIELTISIESFYRKEFHPDILVEDNFRNLAVLSAVIKKCFFEQ